MMRDVDADFGGEHSAHFYYRDNFYADSAILTLLIFMKMLSDNKNKISSCLLYTSPSPRDPKTSRMPSSA